MLLKASKVFYFLLLFYYGWFQYVFFQLPNMLMILGMAIIGFIILDALQSNVSIIRSITPELLYWIIFAFTSLIFGMFVAVNTDLLISQLSTFMQYILLILSIVYISGRDKKLDFFVSTYIAYALLAAVTALFRGHNYGQGRISLGAINNPNALGISMAIGVCCILYRLNFQKLTYSVLSFSAIMLLIYTSFLTGSRKALLSIVIIVVLWFVFIANKEIRALNSSAKIKGLFLLVLLFLGFYSLLYPVFTNSLIFLRLRDLFDSGSTARIGMYNEALRFFDRSPIVGIGFNNYRVLSIYKTYSHSTYAEVLACTGIIGSFLYLCPYILIFVKYVKLFFSKTIDHTLLKKLRIIFLLFSALIFLGVGVIHFYEMTSSIAFGYIIAFYKCNIDSFSYSRETKSNSITL